MKIGIRNLVTAALSSLAVALIHTSVNVASAVPVSYSFTTGNNPFGLPPVGSFSSSDFVSGTFTYDAEALATGTNAFGATIYAGSLTKLAGSVAGLNFSDPAGLTLVGNEVIPSPAFPQPVDFLLLGADPSLGVGTHNLSGFAIGGFTLVNVRMFWIETQLGITDFLANQNLLAALPQFQGRLALDFVPIGNPSGPLSFVFFDGLLVRQIPEPGTLVLLAVGLVGLAFARRLPEPSQR